MIIESRMGMVVVGEAENRRESLAAIAHEPPISFCWIWILAMKMA